MQELHLMQELICLCITTLTLLYTLRLQGGEGLYLLAPLYLPLIWFKSSNSANSTKLKSLLQRISSYMHKLKYPNFNINASRADPLETTSDLFYRLIVFRVPRINHKYTSVHKCHRIIIIIKM